MKKQNIVMDSNNMFPKEPDDVEKAAIKHSIHDSLKSLDGSYESFHNQSELFINGFKAGVQWQKERSFDSELFKHLEELEKRLHERFGWTQAVQQDFETLYKYCRRNLPEKPKT